MVTKSSLDFAVQRSWLLVPSMAAGAGAVYALAGLNPVMAGGAAAGLIPSLAAGVALELRGGSLKTQRDVEEAHGLETLGVIGRFGREPGSTFPAKPYESEVEAYRRLAATLRGWSGKDIRSVLVTSASAEEGKSTTAANLATVLAQTGSSVVLVDADLRYSSLRSTMDKAASFGLSGLLMNHLYGVRTALVRTGEPGLSLLPAGVSSPDPAELLRSPRLGQVMASLRQMADFVVLDSPPVLEVPDASIIAGSVDATLVVMQAGRTRTRQVNRALRTLAKPEARPMAAVLNRVRAKAAGARTAAGAPALPQTSRLATARTWTGPVPQPASLQPGAKVAKAPRPRRGPRPWLRLVGQPEAPTATEATAPEPMTTDEEPEDTGGLAAEVTPDLEASVSSVVSNLNTTLRLIRDMRSETAPAETD